MPAQFSIAELGKISASAPFRQKDAQSQNPPLWGVPRRWQTETYPKAEAFIHAQGLDAAASSLTSGHSSMTADERIRLASPVASWPLCRTTRRSLQQASFPHRK